MPELPEVETARKCVHRNLLYAKVVRAEVLDPRMLEQGAANELERKLQGRMALGTGRHGKNLFVCFDDGALHIHLGMSGSISYCRDVDRQGPHERLRLIMENGVMVLYDPRRFGRFGWVRSVDAFVAMKGLGPDALSVTEEDFVRRLRGRKGSLKSTLLDQRVIAGLGNLYVDEVLFQERLHPTTLVSLVPEVDLRRLCSRTKDVLNSSIAVETDFRRFPPGYLLRQRERGGACPRCGGRFEAVRVGGRTSVFCPKCQRNYAKG